MRDWPREIFIELDVNARIRYCRSEHPPPIEYAVLLEVLVDGKMDDHRAVRKAAFGWEAILSDRNES